MPRYRFHATNGLECVFDATSNDIRADRRLTCHANAVARSVMQSLNDRVDWSDWHVSVHDLKGRRVLVQSFMQPTERLARAV